MPGWRSWRYTLRGGLGRRLLAQLLVSGLVYGVTALAVGYSVHATLVQTVAQVRRLHSVSVNLAGVELAMAQEESGQRGYDLTGVQSFLAPFTGGVALYATDAAHLRAAVSPPLAGLVDEALAAASAWTAAYGLPQIHLREEGRRVSLAGLTAGKALQTTFQSLADRAQDKAAVMQQADLNAITSTVQLAIGVGLAATLLEVAVILILLQRRFGYIIEVIRTLRQAVARYGEGDMRDTPAPDAAPDDDELAALIRGVGEMRVGLARTLDAAHTLSSVDGLTGIANRRSLDEALPAMVEAARRGGGALSVAMVDVDHFKAYNDRFGHHAGDAALQATARVLQDVSRRGDVVARYGGEEFTVVWPGADANDAWSLGERMRHEVAMRLGPTVTISVGVATLHGGVDGPALVEEADRALYRAKRNGRNRVAAAGITDAGPASGEAG